MAYPVAGNPQIGVGGVVQRSEPGGSHRSPQLGACQVEERSTYMTETRRDPRQPFDAAAKQQPQQNRFDLIVGVMAGEDIAGTELPALGFEQR